MLSDCRYTPGMAAKSSESLAVPARRGPLWFARLLNRYFASPAWFVDDRGKPLPSHREIDPSSAMSVVLAEVDPKGETRRRIVRSCMMGFAGVALIYCLFLSGTPWRPTTATYAILPTVICFQSLFFLWQRGREKGFRPSLPAHTATLVAVGRCGSCGYPMIGSMRGADACVECPECGAAWHSDRMVFVEDPAARPRITLRLRSIRTRDVFASIITDDRGVLLGKTVGWPGALSAADLPPQFHEAISSRLEARRRAQRRIPFAALGVCWLLAVAAVAVRDDPADSRLPLVVTILTPIALAVAYIIYRSSVPSRHVRSVFLDLCCCPECNSLLPAGKPEFDGCILCTGCKHAWRLDALGTPPDGPALLLPPCGLGGL